MKRIFLALMFSFIPFLGLAEVPKKAHQLTIDQGMSQSTVGSIYPAKDGRLWFATGDGISIYDGQSFEYVFHNAENKNGLPDNYVRTLFADEDGLIWIGTYGGGIAVYNQKGHFVRGFQKETGSIPAADINDFAQDKNASIWVSSDAGSFRLVRQNEDYVLDIEDLPELLKTAPSRNVLITKSGEVFVATSSDGLLIYSPRSKKLTQYVPENSGFSSRAVYALLEDKVGKIWIGTEGAGVIRFDPETAKFDTPVSLPDTYVSVIDQASDGRLWFGTDFQGVFVYDPNTKRVENYRFREGQPYRLSSNSILAFAEDKMGRMWIGTADGGASSVSVFSDSFETYYPDTEGTAGPVSGVVWSVEEGISDTLWVGTKRGLSRFWQAERRFETIDLGDGSKDVRAMLRREKKLLLGVRNRGLLELDTTSLAVREVLGADGANLFSGIYIRLLLEAQDGSIWVGTHSGVYHLDSQLRLLRHYSADGKVGSLPHDRTRALYESSDGVIWIGTGGGLSRFNIEADTFFTYAGQAVLPDDDVRAVFQKDSNTIYAGTQGGISIIDLASGTARFVLRQQGLPNETLYSLLPDGRGALWITTNNGLARFDLKSEAILVYRARDGLQGAEFNFNAHKALSNGRIFVGGINGFSLFEPSKILINKLPPHLAFQADWEGDIGKDIPEESILVGNAPKSIKFYLGAYHYDEPSENRLRWKLEPRDSDWSEEKGVTHTLVRENLPAGDYVFRAVGISPSGATSKEQVYRFRIAVNPWVRWYAILGYICFATLLFIAALKLRTSQMQKRNKELERLASEKTHALMESNIALQASVRERASFYSRTAHEIRTPLSLIRGPLHSIINTKSLTLAERRNVELIKRATDRLTQIIEEMTEVSQDEAEIATGQASLDLASFLSPILELYRDSAQAKGVHFQYNEPISHAVTLNHRSLETLLHNLLSNAVKNTPTGGKLDFHSELVGDRLRFAIRNDGLGLTEDECIRLQNFAEKSDMPFPRRGLELIGASVRETSGTLSVTPDKAYIQVELPVHHSDHKQDDGQSPLSAVSGNRILIVEDDRDMREYLADLLSPLAEIRSVASLAAAKRAVEREVYHLILCDVMLPDGMSFDFGKQIKENIETSHIPLIFLTALGDKNSYVKGLDAWADDYLTKPFDVPELLAKIRIRLRAVITVREYLTRQLSSLEKPEPKNVPSLPPMDERLIVRFQVFLEENLGESGIVLDDAAKTCAVSKRVLQRKLDALYGQSFSSIVTAARMKRAVELLQTGMGVAEVGKASGYRNASSFARQFKDTYQMSPSDCVKKHKL